MLERLGRALGLKTNPVIFFVSAAIIAAFVPIAAIFDEPFTQLFGAATNWIATNLGWFYILAVTGLLGFLLWVAFGRSGDLKLGPDDAEPEYSDVAWFTMLFAAGIGTVLMFWGVAEPISHFTKPPFRDVEPGTLDAAESAMDIALYHFGLHTWTIFALPGMALGYFVYRRGLPLRVSSVFHPILGDRVHGPIGWAIDTVAVVGTMFGVATSLGLGTLQVASGLDHLFAIPNNAITHTGIIVVITAMATTSVVFGLDAGVRRLSEANILLAVLLLVFVFVTGPTVYILQGMVQAIGSYIVALPELAFWNDAYADDGWQQKWTIFYWAWTISWAPFVGIFVARISYGRTLREFVLGVLLAPTTFSIIWFSVFGIASFDIELNRGGGLAEQVDADVSTAIYGFLQHFPLPSLTCGLAVLVIVIFFTTSSDSASMVIDMLSSGDEEEPPTRQRVFWALSEGAVAAGLLFLGGFKALSNVITTLALPFCGLLVFMAIAMGQAIRKEVGRPDAVPVPGEAAREAAGETAD